VAHRRDKGILNLLDDLVQQQQSAAAPGAAETDPGWRASMGLLDKESARLKLLHQWLDHECSDKLGAPDEYGPVPVNCPDASSTNFGGGR
jgi:hypothetical protein